ncbi:phage tail tape measure protein [Ectopseudomonas alcaliphila]|nr:phage tail tape measure protein [Pseudomonas alcaliphila]MDX5993771.1 phage tail tape measure protein [Pseudomonas alcaliphila]
MKTDYERPLIAYAYLAQSGAQNDILSGLVPLLAPIAKSRAGKNFDRDFLSAELKRLYGIEVHPWAVDELAPRMEKAGILVKKSITKAGAIYSYTDSLGEELSTTSEEDIQNTLEDFINYSKEIMLQAKINVPEDLLRKHFFNQIVTSDFQVRLIKPSTPPKDGRRILQLKENKELSEDEVSDSEEVQSSEPSQQKQIDQMKIISASYVLHTSVNNKKIYEQLLHIASGAILAEYILNLREPNNNFTLSSLRIYLDGPLAMSYLDLNEEKASNYTLMLIESLRDKGASLLIFKGHVDEIRDNLRSAMSQDGSGIRRPTHRRMQGASFRSYAQSILSDLEGTFRRKQITIVSPSKSPSYFSDDAMESLTQALGDYAYHARERDAQAVGGVIRLRAGKINSRSFFHECQHIFLTENKRVASASFNFAIEKIGYKENYVPPVVTDRYLAGLMFVLYGGEAAAKLNHQKLLANCASALEPNHALLSKVTTFLSDVTDSRAGAFVELMTSSRASQHRAIFLLDETRVIHDLADAEKAFEDFEVEIKRSMDAEFAVERQKIAEAHKAEIDAAAASRATLELEQTLADAQYKENIAQQNIAINKLEQELISKTQSLDSLFERQAKQEAAFAASQLEDIKDLLTEAIKKVNQEQKITSWSLGTISFIIIALVNLWGLNIGNSLTLKIACATLLVLVPFALSKISKAFANRKILSRRRDKFYQLLKSRSNLRNIANNYNLDFSTGEAELLTESSEWIAIDTNRRT